MARARAESTGTRGSSGLRKSSASSSNHALHLKPVALRVPRLLSSAIALLLGIALVWLALAIHNQYTFSFQSPLRVRLQFPLAIAQRTRSEDAYRALADQRRPLSVYQQYACRKFGDACRLALAIQRAENPQGKCETYHYNADGTLDWGYFQINTVHLQRPGLNLRDLLDCKANIDFAYQLYREKHSFQPWSTYRNGLYRRYLQSE